MTTDTTLTDGWTFKGQDFKPLSYGRKMMIVGLIDMAGFGAMDIAMFFYAAQCDTKELASAKRKPDEFAAKAMDWCDKVKFDLTDINPAVTIMKEMIEQTGKNQAVPIGDGLDSDDDLGNL